MNTGHYNHHKCPTLHDIRHHDISVLEGVLVRAAIGQVTRGFLGRFPSSLDQMGEDFMDFCEVELWSLENPEPSQDFSVESPAWIG